MPGGRRCSVHCRRFRLCGLRSILRSVALCGTRCLRAGCLRRVTLCRLHWLSGTRMNRSLCRLLCCCLRCALRSVFPYGKSRYLRYACLRRLSCARLGRSR